MDLESAINVYTIIQIPGLMMGIAEILLASMSFPGLNAFLCRMISLWDALFLYEIANSTPVKLQPGIVVRAFL